MNDLASQLAERAPAAGLSLNGAVRQHVLEGLLRRVSASPGAEVLVLRGGLLTRMLVGRARHTEDADFLGLFESALPPADREALPPGKTRWIDRIDAEQRLREILETPLPAEDGVYFDLDSLQVKLIWQETPFPGLRAGVQAEAAGQRLALQIDVGFGDPLVPPAHWIDYPALLPGPPARVQACRPETLVGWKLHGLFEHGARRWRAKDLFDLLLLTRHVPLHPPDLADAIQVAFSSRDTALEEVLPVVYSRSWWSADKARDRWARFRAAAPTAGIPEDLLDVAGHVARALRPALEQLLRFPP